mgnify:CR=1 FL=1
MFYKPHRPAAVNWLIGFVGYGMYGVGGLIYVVLLPVLGFVLFPFRRVRAWVLERFFLGGVFALVRGALPFIGVYRFREISGHAHLADHPRAVVVANHRGRLDGLILLTLLRRAGVLLKGKYERFPLYAQLIRHLDFVPVDPRSRGSVSRALAQCRRLLDRDKPILIFPEGTRAAGARLLPFKDLAFRLALGNGVPVIPVVIHSTRPFMGRQKGSYVPGGRFDYTVRALPPVPALAKERPGAYADRVRRRMREELAAIEGAAPAVAERVDAA